MHLFVSQSGNVRKVFRSKFSNAIFAACAKPFNGGWGFNKKLMCFQQAEITTSELHGCYLFMDITETVTDIHLELMTYHSHRRTHRETNWYTLYVLQKRNNLQCSCRDNNIVVTGEDEVVKWVCDDDGKYCNILHARLGIARDQCPSPPVPLPLSLNAICLSYVSVVNWPIERRLRHWSLCV